MLRKVKECHFLEQEAEPESKLYITSQPVVLQTLLV